MCLVGMVVRKYNYRFPHVTCPYILLLYISALFSSSIPTFVHFLKKKFVLE